MAAKSVTSNLQEGFCIATCLDGVQVTKHDPDSMSALGAAVDTAMGDVNHHQIETVNQQLHSQLSRPTYGSDDGQNFSQPRTARPLSRSSSMDTAIVTLSSRSGTPDRHFRATEIENANEPTSNEPISHIDFMAYAIKNVEYEKRRLRDGDTLVFIDFPGDVPYYETYPTGPVSFPRRVHSKNLLATGSAVFRALLQRDKHHKTCRRRNLVDRLPNGIDWVIDLTPPDEGDEAVNLTSDLSCSSGVRSWASAQKRCSIPGTLVGGKDELIKLDCLVPTSKTSFNLKSTNSSKSNTSTSNVQQQVNSAADVGSGFRRAATAEDETDRQPESKVNQGGIPATVAKSANSKPRRKTDSALSAADTDYDEPDQTPEYSVIRHRAGIERLLQVIEGRDPVLDSAVKMWTLFTLAKYFDCTQTVVDYIITWLLADHNSLFIEVLPEATAKIGMGLKNNSIYRAALSVLISEEALTLVSHDLGKFEADKNYTNQFGRLHEDLDDDMRQVIEYASKSFADRIGKKLVEFLDGETSWLARSREFRKVLLFQHELEINCPNSKLYEKVHNTIEELRKLLQVFVRCNIFYVLSSSLAEDEGAIAEAHREKERYKVNQPWTHFKDLYNKLDRRERIMTTPFWKKLRIHKFSHFVDPNYHDGNHFNEDKRDNGSSSIRIDNINNLEQYLNEAMIEAINAGQFNDGKIPQDSSITYAPSNEIVGSSSLVQQNNKVEDDWWSASLAKKVDIDFDHKSEDQMSKPDVEKRAKAKFGLADGCLKDRNWTSPKAATPWVQPSDVPEVFERVFYVGTGEPADSKLSPIYEKRRKPVVVNSDPISNDSQQEQGVRQRVQRVLGQSGLQEASTRNREQQCWPLKHRQAGGSPPLDTATPTALGSSTTFRLDSIAAKRTDFSNNDGSIHTNANAGTIASSSLPSSLNRPLQISTSWFHDLLIVEDDENADSEGMKQLNTPTSTSNQIWNVKGKGKAVVQDDSDTSGCALLNNRSAGWHQSIDELFDEKLSAASMAKSGFKVPKPRKKTGTKRESREEAIEEANQIADDTSRTWKKPSRARSEVSKYKLDHVRFAHDRALKKSIATQKAAGTHRIPHPGGPGSAFGSNTVPDDSATVLSRIRVPWDDRITPSSQFFSFRLFKQDVEELVHGLCDEMLDTSNMCFDVGVTDTLLCLTDDEYRYLPLWAGGDNDGTGGVFDADVPIADAGPLGPGPGYHTGQTNPSRPNSEWSSMSSITMSGHVSAMADNGHSDYLACGKVYSEGSSQGEWAFVEGTTNIDMMDAGDATSEDEVGTIQEQSVLSFDGLSELGIQSSAASEQGTTYEMSIDDDDDEGFDDDRSEGTCTIGADDVAKWGSDGDWGTDGI